MLEYDEKYALPWCLVIAMSSILRPDPNLPSFPRLDFSSLLKGLLIPSVVVSIEEFGIGMHPFAENVGNK